MMMNIDKRFVELLNENGVEISWEKIKQVYAMRKEEREIEAARQKQLDLENDPTYKFYMAYEKQLEAEKAASGKKKSKKSKD